MPTQSQTQTNRNHATFLSMPTALQECAKEVCHELSLCERTNLNRVTVVARVAWPAFGEAHPAVVSTYSVQIV